MTPREHIEQRAIDYSVEHPSEAPQLDELHFKTGAEYGYNLAVEKAGEVFAQKLIDLCPDMLGYGGIAKHLENEFKQAMKL